jgi:N-acylneuraminate cytidylyltransferase
VNDRQYTAFIFARGGSKGLPGKNLRDLNGKSLLRRAIETCQATPEIGRVVVSTEDKDIAAAAKSLGADVPFVRPSELAKDESPELDAWKHALRELQDTEGQLPGTLVSVPTTAPLREPNDLSNCLELYEKTSADLVITSAVSPHNPYFNLFELSDSGEVSVPMLSSENAFRRQNAPQVHFITPICYVARSSYVLECQNLLEGKVRTLEVEAERAVDIDTMLDFEFAKYLLDRDDRRLKEDT